MPGTMWCTRSNRPAAECPDHGGEHREVRSPLGPADEPQGAGALVVVWPGRYRDQQVWVASGANVGNWYCLGGEFGPPTVWDPPRREFWMADRFDPPRPAGTIPQHPVWDDVLKSGPVHLLACDTQESYLAGFRNGRRRLAEEIAQLAEDDSGA